MALPCGMYLPSAVALVADTGRPGASVEGEKLEWCVMVVARVVVFSSGLAHTETVVLAWLVVASRWAAPLPVPVPLLVPVPLPSPLPLLLVWVWELGAGVADPTGVVPELGWCSSGQL